MIYDQANFQLDESTVRGSEEALLLTYVRFVKHEQNVEEMLFSNLLTTFPRSLALLEFHLQKQKLVEML